MQFSSDAAVAILLRMKKLFGKQQQILCAKHPFDNYAYLETRQTPNALEFMKIQKICTHCSWELKCPKWVPNTVSAMFMHKDHFSPAILKDTIFIYEVPKELKVPILWSAPEPMRVP